MSNMTRESLRALGISDETTIDNILKMRGSEIDEASLAEAKLKKELAEANKKNQDVDSLTARIKELEAKNMSAEELQAQKIKAAEESQKKYERLSNKIEAQKVLLNAGMYAGDGLERILDRISTENLETTIESANAIADMFKLTQENTEKHVREEMLRNNPTPPASNTSDENEVTVEKFNKMSYEEMARFAKENPESFAKM